MQKEPFQLHGNCFLVGLPSASIICMKNVINNHMTPLLTTIMTLRAVQTRETHVGTHLHKYRQLGKYTLTRDIETTVLTFRVLKTIIMVLILLLWLFILQLTCETIQWLTGSGKSKPLKA